MNLQPIGEPDTENLQDIENLQLSREPDVENLQDIENLQLSREPDVENLQPISKPEENQPPTCEHQSQENQAQENQAEELLDSQSQTRLLSNPEEITHEDHDFPHFLVPQLHELSGSLVSGGTYEYPRPFSLGYNNQPKNMLESPIYDEPQFLHLDIGIHEELRQKSLESASYDEIGEFLRSLSSNCKKTPETQEPVAYENPLTFRTNPSDKDSSAYHKTNFNKQNSQFKPQPYEESQTTRRPRENSQVDSSSEPVPYAVVTFCGTPPTIRQKTLSRELLLPENTSYSSLWAPLQPQPYEVSLCQTVK